VLKRKPTPTRLGLSLNEGVNAAHSRVRPSVTAVASEKLNPAPCAFVVRHEANDPASAAALGARRRWCEAWRLEFCARRNHSVLPLTRVRFGAQTPPLDVGIIAHPTAATTRPIARQTSTSNPWRAPKGNTHYPFL